MVFLLMILLKIVVILRSVETGEISSAEQDQNISSINLIEEVCPSDCCKVSLTLFQPINSSVLKSFQHQ